MNKAQLILLALIALIVIKIVRQLIKRKIYTQEFLGWFIFWGVVAYIVINPQFTQFLAEKMGIGRGADLIVYFSLIFIYYALFHIFAKQKEMEQSITVLGREIAIAGAKDYTKDKNLKS